MLTSTVNWLSVQMGLDATTPDSLPVDNPTISWSEDLLYLLFAVSLILLLAVVLWTLTDIGNRRNRQRLLDQLARLSDLPQLEPRGRSHSVRRTKDIEHLRVSLRVDQLSDLDEAIEYFTTRSADPESIKHIRRLRLLRYSLDPPRPDMPNIEELSAEYGLEGDTDEKK